VEKTRKSLGEAWHDRLAQPLTELYSKAAASTKKDLTAIRASIQQPEGRVRSLVRNVKDKVLTTSGRALDYLLPEEEEASVAEKVEETAESAQEAVAAAAATEEEDEKSVGTVTFRELTKRASKRLRKKATVSLGTLRHFSANRMKSVIHVDLIQYAEDVIDQASGLVTPVKGRAAELLQTSIDSTRKAVENTKAQLAKVAANTVETAQAQRERISFSKRLATVRRRASELGAVGWKALSTRKIGEVPRDVYALALKSLGLRERDAEYQELMQSVVVLGDAAARLVFVFTQLQEESAAAPEERVEAVEVVQSSLSPVKEEETSPVLGAASTEEDEEEVQESFNTTLDETVDEEEEEEEEEESEDEN